MPSPFPGMDPWLENLAAWPDFQLTCIAEIKRALNQRLRPKYIARADERVYVSDDDDPGPPSILVPDVRISRSAEDGRLQAESLQGMQPVVATVVDEEETHEPRVEILDAESHAVVTVIEVLSPANKISGSRGRESFREKRRQVFRSTSHWVEIDLLRSGIRSVSIRPESPCDYRVLASRAEERPELKAWRINLRESLPKISIPLKTPDPDVLLDLQQIVSDVYEALSYGLVVNYGAAPIPPLRPGDAQWAEDLLKRARRRWAPTQTFAIA